MIEREWREASDLRTSRMALAIVLIAAAVLRFWALDRGIPYAVQIDEPEIVERDFSWDAAAEATIRLYRELLQA